nr:MAG TPA: hypothetical protein [Caudoviricetes sp.]
MTGECSPALPVPGCGYNPLIQGGRLCVYYIIKPPNAKEGGSFYA